MSARSFAGVPASAGSRILVLLTDGFGGHGGIAKFNRDLLGALCSHATTQQVVAVPRIAPDPTGPLPSNLEYRLDGLGGPIGYARAVAKLLLWKKPFDRVVCGHINLLPFAMASAARWRADVTLVVHGIDAWQPTSRPLTNLLTSRIDRFVAVSDFTRQRFLAWARLREDQGHILPNCVDLEDFSPGPKSTGLLRRYGIENSTVLLTVARLSASERYKGVDEVLESFPALLNEVPDLAYLVVGDGDDLNRLRQKARALEIDSRVVFAGRISEHEKADHYRLADAFVMPSRGEGFGIVFLEAMACGVPVLASALDGSREAVRGNPTSVLVDPADVGALRAGIRTALSYPRGVVPQSVQNFSRAAFDRRVHSLLEAE